jgi:hypothetical protein
MGSPSGKGVIMHRRDLPGYDGGMRVLLWVVLVVLAIWAVVLALGGLPFVDPRPSLAPEASAVRFVQTALQQ